MRQLQKQPLDDSPPLPTRVSAYRRDRFDLALVDLGGEILVEPIPERLLRCLTALIRQGPVH